MAEVSVSRVVNAPASRVWESWNRFDEIYRFNPNIHQSPLLPDSPETGMGAERICRATDGKTYLKERIISYSEGEHLVIDIFDTNIPVKKAVVTIDFAELNPSQTRVSMTITFTPKFGLFGLLLIPVMTSQLKKGFAGLLDGNADFVEHGTEIHPKAQAA